MGGGRVTHKTLTYTKPKRTVVRTTVAKQGGSRISNN